MGLLDYGMEDPMMGFAMGLLQAGGPSRTPVSFGQALAQGYGGYQQARQAKSLQEMRDLEVEKAKQAAEDAKAMRNFDPTQFYQSPQQQAIAKYGPTPEGAAAIGQFKPKLDQQAMIQYLMKSPNIALRQKGIELATKKPETIKVSEGDVILDEQYKPIFSNPKTDRQALPEVAKLQQYLGTLPEGDPRRADVEAAIRKATTHQPATNVTVERNSLGMTANDRFNAEDKLRNDYSKSTELDSKLLGHSSKLKSILAGDPNAMKDQATIYQFAKLLDPDGAVREADYAAILNTAGLETRIRNWLNQLATGQMLSPQQRAEMEGVLNQFEQVAQRRISRQQTRFGETAKRYQLEPANIFEPTGGGSRPPLSAFNRGG